MNQPTPTTDTFHNENNPHARSMPALAVRVGDVMQLGDALRLALELVDVAVKALQRDDLSAVERFKITATLQRHSAMLRSAR